MITSRQRIGAYICSITLLMQHRNGKQTFCDHLLKKTFKEIKVFKISIISWTSSSDHLAVLGWVKAPRTLVMYTLMFPPRSSLWFFLGIFDLYKHYTLDFWPWATWKFLTYTVQVVQMPTLIKWCHKHPRFYAKSCTSPLSPTYIRLVWAHLYLMSHC